VIETIRDLERASQKEIDDALRNIDIRGIVTKGLVERGRRPGYTMDQWREKRDSREPEDCPTCYGRGTVLEPIRTVGTVHASGACKCVVSIYYDVTGEIAPKEELKPELLITFGIGHAIHGLVQDVLHDQLGDTFADEVRVDLQEAMILNGSADGIIWLPRCRVLLEIKTISETEYGKLRKPKPEHLIQARDCMRRGSMPPSSPSSTSRRGGPTTSRSTSSPTTRGYSRTGTRSGAARSTRPSRKVDPLVQRECPPTSVANASTTTSVPRPLA